MKIDRRITNGLAWAGAVLVVAIPAADFVLRQAEGTPNTQFASVQEKAASPRPTTERPQVAQAESTPVTPSSTAAPARSTSGGDAVDSFMQSGRELPSYISGGSPAAAPAAPRPAATTPAPVATPAPTTTRPVVTTPPPATAAAPVTPPTAAPIKTVTLPTPVSQRPPSVDRAAAPIAAAPVTLNPRAPLQSPLIIDQPAAVVTAQDLADWESGPLSDFLANRGGGRQAQPAPVSDYDENGFFLDQGPNSNRQPYPRPYGEGFYYPFSD